MTSGDNGRFSISCMQGGLMWTSVCSHMHAHQHAAPEYPHIKVICRRSQELRALSVGGGASVELGDLVATNPPELLAEGRAHRQALLQLPCMCLPGQEAQQLLGRLAQHGWHTLRLQQGNRREERRLDVPHNHSNKP